MNFKPRINEADQLQREVNSTRPLSGNALKQLKAYYRIGLTYAWLHIRLVSIHPFIDGNGRTARLLMNLALLKAGYPIAIIPPVLRGDYIDALKASNRGTNQHFVNLLSNMVCESQRDYLRLLSNLGED